MSEEIQQIKKIFKKQRKSLPLELLNDIFREANNLFSFELKKCQTTYFRLKQRETKTKTSTIKKQLVKDWYECAKILLTSSGIVYIFVGKIFKKTKMTEEQNFEGIDATFFASQAESDNIINNLTNIIRESRRVNEEVTRDVKQKLETVTIEVNTKLEELTTMNRRLESGLILATRHLSQRRMAQEGTSDVRQNLRQTRSLGSVPTPRFTCPYCGRTGLLSHRARHYKSKVCSEARKRKVDETEESDGKKRKTTDGGNDGASCSYK
ncbi:hypothetical protein ACQ4LE_010499 [Meloidogyne hapla]